MFFPVKNNRCSAGNLSVQNHESCIKLDPRECSWMHRKVSSFVHLATLDWLTPAQICGGSSKRWVFLETRSPLNHKYTIIERWSRRPSCPLLVMLDLSFVLVETQKGDPTLLVRYGCRMFVSGSIRHDSTTAAVIFPAKWSRDIKSSCCCKEIHGWLSKQSPMLAWPVLSRSCQVGVHIVVFASTVDIIHCCCPCSVVSPRLLRAIVVVGLVMGGFSRQSLRFAFSVVQAQVCQGKGTALPVGENPKPRGT